MPRLIDADALPIDSIDMSNMIEVTDRGIAVVRLEDIIDAPTIDAVSVVHGTWEKDDDGEFICSNCNNGYKDQPTLMGRPMFEYCPICGAKMDGEREGE